MPMYKKFSKTHDIDIENHDLRGQNLLLVLVSTDLKVSVLQASRGKFNVYFEHYRFKEPCEWYLNACTIGPG